MDKRLARVVISICLFLGILVTIIFSTQTSYSEESNKACASGCPTSTLNEDLSHGMRIFGSKKIYLSHKSFLNTPSEAHNFQGIFEISLSSDTLNPEQVYLKDQNTSAMNEYTLMPTQGFTKSDLLQGKVKSFTGQLYRGDIEECLRKVTRGASTCPISLLPGNLSVTVTIKKAVFICDYANTACKPKQPSSKLEYILFGDTTEQYVAHRITGAKDGDFDQIMKVSTPLKLTSGQSQTLLQKNYLMLTASKLANLRSNAIRPKQAVKSQSGAEFLINGIGKSVTLKIAQGDEYFMETDPNIF
jgi:hypothetical protein